MNSVCWSCRLQLAARPASRVPVSQRHRVRSLEARATTWARGLHHSARQQLPRARPAAPPRGSALGARGAPRDDAQRRGGDAAAVVGQDTPAAEHAGQPSGRRRARDRGVRVGQDVDAAQHAVNLEANVRLARQTFKDSLPEGLLDDDGMRVYERLYGRPSKMLSREELEQLRDAGQAKPRQDARLMRETPEGELEELGPTLESDTRSLDGASEGVHEQAEAALENIGDQVLLEYGEALEQQALDETLLTQQQRDILDNDAISRAFEARAEELDLEEDDEHEVRDEDEDEQDDFWPGDEHRIRTHPLTAMGRFRTSPTTIVLPNDTFVEPIKRAIAPVTTRQMRQVAEHVFDGPGLPYSPATPKRALSMPQKPIPMQSSDKHMNDMESYVYAATVMPGVYASTLSVLTEIRKRLGTAWIRDLMHQDGGPVVLDAGAGGAGVLAWRDLMRAEWESIHEEAAMEGVTLPYSRQPPAGKATVLTASSSLRNRMTKLLDETSFIPRMPESVKADSQEQRKRYDVIIAPHTLWPLEKDYMRKAEVDKLWSLLKPDGGVLVLLEKGVPRGFEVIAGARAHLLKRRIAAPAGSSPDPVQAASDDIYSKEGENGVLPAAKETGMIVAPCTNHGPCPMYKFAGISQARKDWCHFSQRYTRPPFLQHILGASKRNHDDVEYSYVVVQRGRDARQDGTETLPATQTAAQDSDSNDLAFQGYEAHHTTNPPKANDNIDALDTENVPDATAAAAPADPASASLAPHPLSLPRLILPPLKRKKHVIIDVCTPAATLERWTVTKGFSAQAYRDARKSSWGDLWALGAKSRAPKRVNLGKQARQVEEAERRRLEGKQNKDAAAEAAVTVEVSRGSADTDRWRKKDAKKKRRKEGRKKPDVLLDMFG